MRFTPQRIAGVLTHNQCVHVSAIGCQFEQDVMPAIYEQHFLLHAQVGRGPIQSAYAERLNYNLPANQAYALVQPDVYCHPYQQPGHEGEVALHLFGIVSGINPGHSLGAAQRWFPGSQQLINQVLSEHVRGRLAVACGPCWRPGSAELPRLAELHEQIMVAIIQGGCTVRRDVPGDYSVAVEPDVDLAS